MGAADLVIFPLHAISGDANGGIITGNSDASADFSGLDGQVKLQEFQDNYDPKYNITNTFGRMDPIVNYQGTSRKILVAIELTQDSDGGLDIHDKIKKLLYPTYDAASTIPNALLIQRPPLVAVKMGSLIHSPLDPTGFLLCVLESYTMTPGLGFTPLDSPLVRLSTNPDNPITAFQTYNFRFDFIPLHPVTPGFVEDSSGKFQWVGGDDF